MLIANMYIIYKYQPLWCPTPNSFVISGSRSPNPINLACGVESQVGQCGRLHQASDLVESTPTAGRFLLWAPRTNRDPKRQDCASFSNWSQGSWSVWNMKAKPKIRIHETFQRKSRTNSWWRLRCSNRNFVEGVGHHQEYQTSSEPIGGNKVVALSPGSLPQSCAQELCDKQNVLFFRYLNPWTQLSSGKNGTKGVFFQGRSTSWKKQKQISVCLAGLIWKLEIGGEKSEDSTATFYLHLFTMHVYSHVAKTRQKKTNSVF